MIKGFRDFLMRGNIVDLAVAVIIGTAFGAVVAKFSTDFIGGLIGAIGGVPDFNKKAFTINGSDVIWGSTVTALINFVIVAAVIYFAVVIPMNKLKERRASGDEDAGPDEVELLAEIRDLIKARG